MEEKNKDGLVKIVNSLNSEQLLMWVEKRWKERADQLRTQKFSEEKINQKEEELMTTVNTFIMVREYFLSSCSKSYAKTGKKFGLSASVVEHWLKGRNLPVQLSYLYKTTGKERYFFVNNTNTRETSRVVGTYLYKPGGNPNYHLFNAHLDCIMSSTELKDCLNTLIDSDKVEVQPNSKTKTFNIRYHSVNLMSDLNRLTKNCTRIPWEIAYKFENSSEIIIGIINRVAKLTDSSSKLVLTRNNDELRKHFLFLFMLHGFLPVEIGQQLHLGVYDINQILESGYVTSETIREGLRGKLKNSESRGYRFIAEYLYFSFLYQKARQYRRDLVKSRIGEHLEISRRVMNKWLQEQPNYVKLYERNLENLVGKVPWPNLINTLHEERGYSLDQACSIATLFDLRKEMSSNYIALLKKRKNITGMVERSFFR